MKIAIWLDSEYFETIGGGFSYYDRLINEIDNYSFDPILDICYITDCTPKNKVLTREIIQLEYNTKLKLIDKLKYQIPFNRNKFRNNINQKINREKELAFVDQILDAGIRLIYYIKPATILSKYNLLRNIPFVATNWDIGHRSSFTFPEVSSLKEFDFRNNYYNNILAQALMIFCESNSGKQELSRYTGINENRMAVVPIFPGKNGSINVPIEKQERIMAKYGLSTNQFFYYPAQFWAHKNHYTLVNVFAEFVKRKPFFKLVLTGFDQGNLQYIKDVVLNLNIQSSVIFADFVDSETVYTFYKNATAMIMIPMFGPTNMPPLEAMEAGCPVICSDLPGHREELGDAAIYVNPLDKTNILCALNNIVDNRNVFCELIKKQHSSTPHNIENALLCINNNLLKAMEIRNLWK